MRATKIAAKFWIKLNFQVIAVVIGMSFMTVTHANDIQVRKYEGGNLSDLGTLGFTPSAGPWVKNSNGNIQTDLMVSTWCLRKIDQPRPPIRCIFGVETLIGYEPNGQPIWHTEDALEFLPKGSGLQFLSDSEHNCVSTLYINLSVVAIGRWRWRERPKIGGYAHSIYQAWVIDPATKKFKGVPAKSVSCEINEDID